MHSTNKIIFKFIAIISSLWSLNTLALDDRGSRPLDPMSPQQIQDKGYRITPVSYTDRGKLINEHQCRNQNGKYGDNIGFMECGTMFDCDNRLVGKDLSGAALAGLSTSANFNAANLSGADLRGMSMTMSVVNVPRFVRCDFSAVGANFQNANLENSRVMAGNFKNADFRGANMKGMRVPDPKNWMVSFEGALYDDKTVLPFNRDEAEFRGMIYSPISVK